jgi:peptide/nickel transport system permease protein
MSATTTSASGAPSRLRVAARPAWLASLASNRETLAGLLLLGLLLIASVAVSLLGADPNHQDLAHALLPPGSRGHLLGTDPLGRDVLTWCAGGVRVALLVSFAVVAISTVVGVAVGVIAGYVGGPLDALLMRIVDLQLAVPPILLVLAASAVVRPTMTGLIAILAALFWVPYARLVRTGVQVDRGRGYVAAARLAGVGHLTIMRRHIAPGTLPIVIVLSSLQAGYVVLAEVALSFLGQGIQPPATSLGYLIADGKDQLASAWWVVVIPGLVIIALVFGLNLIGDGLRRTGSMREDALAGR